jgi:hypothetical protein
MYASVRRYTMGAGSIDSLMHQVDQEFAPAISQEPGFVAYFALDTGDTEVSGGEVLVSRITPEVLDEAHRWRSGRARSRPA